MANQNAPATDGLNFFSCYSKPINPLYTLAKFCHERLSDLKILS